MDVILKEIDKALKKKGLSDAAASKLAVGHPALIKKLRLPSKGEKRYNYLALEKLADVLDLELYFGPPRETPASDTDLVLPNKANPDDFSLINLHDVQASAGAGSINHSENVISSLAFRKDWLARKGLSPAHASLIHVKGDSMEPTLYDRSLVLIDQQKTTPGNRRMFAFREGTELYVKRLEKPDTNTLIISADNPKYPTRVLVRHDMNAIHIIGEVVWKARDI